MKTSHIAEFVVGDVVTQTCAQASFRAPKNACLSASVSVLRKLRIQLQATAFPFPELKFATCVYFIFPFSLRLSRLVGILCAATAPRSRDIKGTWQAARQALSPFTLGQVLSSRFPDRDESSVAFDSNHAGSVERVFRLNSFRQGRALAAIHLLKMCRDSDAARA